MSILIFRALVETDQIISLGLRFRNSIHSENLDFAVFSELLVLTSGTFREVLISRRGRQSL